MVSQASDGLDSVHIKALRNLVHRYKNIWRVKLSADGPAKVTPLKIHLKPDAIPRRAKAQRYAPKHLDFMRKHVKVLEGYIRHNTLQMELADFGGAETKGSGRVQDDCRYTVS